MTDIVEAVTDELLAHGEFSSGANNRSNARIAAEVVINMVRQAASRGSAGGDVDPADIWDAYCEEVPAKSRSPQGAMAFAIDRLSNGAAQASLPPLVDRAELVGLLEDLASVNLSREAVERQARRMADDLIARGLSVPSAHREAGK